ncbi:MAG: Gfo/Idh/MocA family oxidoreductase, partial [Sedimentisphaerales bacterium]|nr:Gfo/Idh/MocA family oxidoreductase [Sedimentisphaerales bacterium]
RSSALGKAGTVAPSNRIVMASIGLGIQGTGNMRAFLGQKDVHVTAVCDVSEKQRQKAKTQVDAHYGNEGCLCFGDFREVCARPDIDAVVLAAPDHWHVLIGLEAARNGKHMYYEKPIGWSFRAAQVLRETVKRYGVVFQFGTQQRSGRDFRFACELVRNGCIGKLETILVGVPGGVQAPDLPTEPVPDDLDYDMWLGPALWAPYSYERCRPYTRRPDKSWTLNYSTWYHIPDYCIGFIGNWGIHHVDIAQWGHGAEDTGPVEIEGRGVFPQGSVPGCALTWKVENRFSDGVTMVHMDNQTSAEHPDQVPGFSQGILFRGDEGWVFVNRSKLDAHPKSLLKSQMESHEVRLHESSSHHRDFLDAVRTGTTTACPIDVAVRSNTICQLDDIAIRLGRTLRWDPQKEECINDPQAARMLARPMRSPWRL